ncbi:MAG: PIG-L family deacetylase [Candidatus Omnitrophica bacterium]|nr:PIG-L family deacetylase [Candidatus Omnitrophota bacterium]MDD5236084.1 PIG-L family deacetylase [Candidatus Omnitrophota bacterium]MDD5611052.1 PIG-L family deacetylase [Candidatus Omnitrophota bacterium]
MNILALGVHPDDIEFGCGATLFEFVRRKHSVFIFIATEGEIGAGKGIRKREQIQAAKFSGVKKIFWGGFADTQVPVNKELIDKIEAVIHEVKPDIVFFNYPDDTHQDHRALANCAMSATRHIKRVLFYEVPTTRNFEPDVFTEATRLLHQKLRLLSLHKSQIKKTRVPGLTILDSVRACAIFRGFQARVKYAEGFKSLRFILDMEKGPCG